MKNPQLVGLVATGSMARSWVFTVAAQSDSLGPVLSSNFRVASRFANTLQAGKPAESYESLNSCKLILIRVAEDELFEVLDGMAKAEIQWKGKLVILCDTATESSEWSELESRGAAVATLTYTEVGGYPRYVIEGSPRAVAEAPVILDLPRMQVIELGRCRKSVYLAGQQAAGMIVPLAAAAEEELRKAGVSPETAAWLVEQMLSDRLRAYKKAGRRAWNGDWIRFRTVFSTSLRTQAALEVVASNDGNHL